MSVKYPEVFRLTTSSRMRPRGKNMIATAYIVDTANPFSEELRKLSDEIGVSLRQRSSVSILASGETGLVAVAALVRQPALSEVVTIWTVFEKGTTEFAREGIAWLNQSRDALVPLLGKVTTVYTMNGFENPEENLPNLGPLKGARRIPVTYPDTDIKTWRDGIRRAWEQPVDVFFNKWQ